MSAVRLSRLPDWQLRLEALVRERRGLAFAWGVRDCCLWGADVVAAITGRDPMADLRGAYASEEEARELLAGLGTLRHLVTARVGNRTRPSLARPGDIGLTLEAGRGCIVAHTGGVWMGQGADGLAPVRDEGVRIAWRIG